ncbi:hypothetical protein M885DRAFT_589255 [Pelagophyceae sp. CCMP2097]|nr:hypothetical protein M885DRAFT_589255 [Pelagophyceae sp. CCMP2097]
MPPKIKDLGELVRRAREQADAPAPAPRRFSDAAASIRARLSEPGPAKGAFSRLSVQNKVRCLSAQFLTLQSKKWPHAADKLFSRTMHLAPAEVLVLYDCFRAAGRGGQGGVEVGRAVGLLGLEHSDFANRLFCLAEYATAQSAAQLSGACDFEGFVLSCWTACTLTPHAFRDFVFELYDADESGCLDEGELKEMLIDVTTETGAASDATALLMQDVQTTLRDYADNGLMAQPAFTDFCATRPGLLGPAYFLQQRMREAYGGAAFWAAISKRCEAPNFDLEGGQAQSNFVRLRQQLRERQESGSAQAARPRRSSLLEAARHRRRKEKRKLVDAAAAKQSIAMCARSNAVAEHPVVTRFKHGKYVALDVLEDIEAQAEAMLAGLAPVQKRYMDDPALVHDMARSCTLRDEQAAGGEALARLAHWISRVGDLDAVLGDETGEFTAVRERFDQRKAAGLAMSPQQALTKQAAKVKWAGLKGKLAGQRALNFADGAAASGGTPAVSPEAAANARKSKVAPAAKERLSLASLGKPRSRNRGGSVLAG